MRIYAVLDTQDRKHIMKAVKAVVRESVRQVNQLPRRAATEVRPLLLNAISRNQYAAGYRAYTAKYAAWKKAQGFGNTYWLLSGDLQSAIRVFPRNIRIRSHESAWMAGIPGGMMSSRLGKRYSNKTPSSVEIAKYARVMEYGGNFGRGGNHPSRPLFRPIAAHYRVSRKFKKQGVVSLLKIARKWK